MFIGVGTLAGGAMGFWVQNKYLEWQRGKNEEYIEHEARKRYEEERLRGEMERGKGIPRPASGKE